MLLGLTITLSFVAAAVPGAEAQPVRIVAVGDFGVGGEAQRRIGESVERFVERRGADVLVTLGDNDYTLGVDFAANWRASFGWLADAGVLRGRPGCRNHRQSRLGARPG